MMRSAPGTLTGQVITGPAVSLAWSPASDNVGIDGYRCDDVVSNVVHFSLSGVADPATRNRLQAIPTGLPAQPIRRLSPGRHPGRGCSFTWACRAHCDSGAICHRAAPMIISSFRRIAACCA